MYKRVIERQKANKKPVIITIDGHFKYIPKNCGYK